MTYYCSADCHLIEPGDLWKERLPQEYRDRAPGYEYTDGHRIWKIGDRKLSKEPLEIEARDNGDPITDDIPLRLKELEADGIWAETIFGNMGFFCFGFEDPGFAMASARVYNDYLAEAFGPYAGREFPIAAIPVRDIPAALEEIERVARLGLKGIALPMHPPAPYFLDIYDPIWAAAQALGLPISFHVGTGLAGSDKAPALAVSAMLGGGGPLSPKAKRAIVTMGGSMISAVPAQQLLGTLIGAGVLDAYPELHVVIVECGAGWLAQTMEALDYAWVPKVGANRDKNRPLSYNEKGEEVDSGFEFKRGGWPHALKPSEYVRRQVHVTFMDEPAPVLYREFTGVEPLLWGSDFPHPEGTWPRSREVTDRLFAGVDPADKAAIVGGNLAKLYNIQLPEPAAV